MIELQAPPSEQSLRLMLKNSLEKVVAQLIVQFNLPYRIENGELLDALQGTEVWLKQFITKDRDTLGMLDDVVKLAKSPDEVLITGETGTGKELIARAMIGNRAENKGRFIAANCAGFPEQLIESELFGYVKGAFTGAEGQRQGLFATANNGVLFLDEIGELPLSVQAKLLRALQDKRIRRVGATVEEDINCKFVCATHRNIKSMVDKGLFRQDLYARISTFELHIKPLRERAEDVVPILMSLTGGESFLGELRRQGKTVGVLNLELNCRSLQQYVKRWNVLGRLVI